MTSLDLEALSRIVERGRAAGEFAGSSDAAATYLPKYLAAGPSDVVVAEQAGRIVGFVSPEFKVVVVEPDVRRQGIGRALVEAAIDGEVARGRRDLILGPRPDDIGSVAFLEATGFAFHSTLWDLTLPPTAAVPAPVWPSGVAARPFDRARDVEAWVDLFNAAFADHPTPLRLDLEETIRGLEDPAYQDDDVILVASIGEPDRPVGFCATTPDRSGGAVGPHAEIWTVGVRPDRQGSGLGRQLLRWGVGYLRSIGAAEISLSVNGRNELALRLYETEGFVRTSTRERWTRPVGPPSAPR